MHLFVDTETTGFIRKNGTPLHQQPHLVQLAFITSAEHEDGTLLEASYNAIIKPDGYTIPDEAARIHGITTERAFDEGEPLQDVMSDFRDAVASANVMVAHNMAYDHGILDISWQRAFDENMPEMELYCTMLASVEACAIPHARWKNKFKWPKLREAYLHYFGPERLAFLFGNVTEEHPDGEFAHDALVDVRACRDIFYHQSVIKS